MRAVVRLMTELLFPRLCVGCGYLGVYLCLHCEKELAFALRDGCMYCRKASAWGLTHAACTRPDGIEGFMTIFYYNTLVKKVVKSIKYRLAYEVLHEFLENIPPMTWEKLAFFRRRNSNCIVVAIPLHKTRERKRGFNQAQILAAHVAGITGLRYKSVLTRIHANVPQATMKRGLRRRQNVHGVFSVVAVDTVQNKDILLVDDVVTTGATVKEAARVLKRAGAARVYVFALAKG